MIPTFASCRCYHFPRTSSFKKSHISLFWTFLYRYSKQKSFYRCLFAGSHSYLLYIILSLAYTCGWCRHLTIPYIPTLFDTTMYAYIGTRSCFYLISNFRIAFESVNMYVTPSLSSVSREGKTRQFRHCLRHFPAL